MTRTPDVQLLDPRRVQFTRESSKPIIDELEELAELTKLAEGREVVLIDGRLVVPTGLQHCQASQRSQFRPLG